MKIQNTQPNLQFGNQYAIYERTARKDLQSLGTNKIARQTIERLIKPIGYIQQGDGMFVFKNGAVNNDKSIITLSGDYLKGRSDEKLPVSIDFRRCAGPQTVQVTVLNYLKTNLGIDLIN